MGRTIIENKQGLAINFKELLEYKDLFWTLAYRDLKVRYAQTFLGFLWAFAQPLFNVLIFTVVFNKTLNVQTGNIPYPIFAMSGLCLWAYFSFILSQAGSSILSSQSMVQKIYFPRLIIPLSKAVLGFVDFGISLVLLFIFMIYYKVLPSQNILFFPFFILWAIITSLGIGIWLSAVTLRYRDFQAIIPFFVHLLFYMSPIAFSTSHIKDRYELFFYLNPITGIIEGWRWCLFDTAPPNNLSWISLLMSIGLFVSSLFYFRKVEKVMADII